MKYIVILLTSLLLVHDFSSLSKRVILTLDYSAVVDMKNSEFMATLNTVILYCELLRPLVQAFIFIGFVVFSYMGIKRAHKACGDSSEIDSCLDQLVQIEDIDDINTQIQKQIDEMKNDK